jgi:hypothetical protein
VACGVGVGRGRGGEAGAAICQTRGANKKRSDAPTCPPLFEILWPLDMSCISYVMKIRVLVLVAMRQGHCNNNNSSSCNYNAHTSCGLSRAWEACCH